MKRIQALETLELDHYLLRTKIAITMLNGYYQAYLTCNKKYFSLHNTGLVFLKIAMLNLSKPPSAHIQSNEVAETIFAICKTSAQALVEKKVFPSIQDVGSFLYEPFYTQELYDLRITRVLEEMVQSVQQQEFKIFTNLHAVMAA